MHQQGQMPLQVTSMKLPEGQVDRQVTAIVRWGPAGSASDVIDCREQALEVRYSQPTGTTSCSSDRDPL